MTAYYFSWSTVIIESSSLITGEDELRVGGNKNWLYDILLQSLQWEFHAIFLHPLKDRCHLLTSALSTSRFTNRWLWTFITRFRVVLDAVLSLFPLPHHSYGRSCFLNSPFIRDLDSHPSYWRFECDTGPHKREMLFGSCLGVNHRWAFLITSSSFTPTSTIKKKVWRQQMHASCNYL